MNKEEVDSIESNNLVKSFTAAGVVAGLTAGLYGPGLLMNDPVQIAYAETAGMIFGPLVVGSLTGQYLGVVHQYGKDKANEFFAYFAKGDHLPPVP